MVAIMVAVCVGVETMMIMRRTYITGEMVEVGRGAGEDEDDRDGGYKDESDDDEYRREWCLGLTMMNNR
jgi:hypothetical protein